MARPLSISTSRSLPTIIGAGRPSEAAGSRGQGSSECEADIDENTCTCCERGSLLPLSWQRMATYRPSGPIETDMILAVIGEELGLIGTTAVIGAFAAFAFAGFTVALRCRDPFGKLLAAGVTSLVCGQAAVNLAAVLGVAPLTGIPLPFVSYGGSSLVVLLASVGILLNIASDERAPQRAASPDRRRRNSRPRPAVARDRRSAARARRHGDVRRVAGSRRG